MDNRLISVIVPIYNTEKYLDRCLESIVNQTYENLEIILVDDGSTDNSAEKCDNWAKRDNRIKVIHKRNEGASAARNTGIDASNGDYIAFVDSDDYIDLNMYEVLYKNAVKTSAEMSICGLYDAPEYLSGVFCKEDILALYFNYKLTNLGVTTKLYSKELIGDTRFDVTKKIGEDFLFNYYVLKKTSKLVSVSEAFYHYTDNDDSSSYQYKVEVLERWKTTRFILENELLTDRDYESALALYVNELFTVAKEVLSSNNKEVINKYYKTVTDELKKYYCRFSALNKSKAEQISHIKLMLISPMLFKLIYMLRSRLKGNSYDTNSLRFVKDK